VPLPEDFVSYLLEDGLFLPEKSDAMPRRTQERVPSKDTAWIATTGDFGTLNPTRFILLLSGRKCSPV